MQTKAFKKRVTNGNNVNKGGRTDVYQLVTDAIIAKLEQGIIPWRKPWEGVSGGWLGNGARSYVTGREYSLINQFLLSSNEEYISFKEIQKRQAHLKKGSKSEPVVFFKLIRIEDENEEKGYKDIPMLKHFRVFKLSDVEGLQPHEPEKPNVADFVGADNERIANCEEIVEQYRNREGVKIHEEIGDNAFYRPSTDEIVVPLIQQFESAKAFYDTLFHEMVHSTGTKNRLNREMVAHFGSKQYANEELTAEIGGAMLLNAAGFSDAAITENNAAYIQSWLEKLRNDKKLIVVAAQRSEKAVRFILTGEKPEVAEN